MKCKTAFLIINPHVRNNVSKLADILAVFSAAGWKTDTALREFGGHTMQLAREAADAGYDLVIAYGGDGTLNQVVNGVMAAERRRTIVGVIPGGTANVWAHEIGMPEDPVKAALLLVNSEGRKVDLGHVELSSLSLPLRTKDRNREDRIASGGRHHFLLMAGLGLDAAILRKVSTSLKEHVGEAAVALAAAEVVPSHQAFPVEIRSLGAGKDDVLLWKGEALQVVVGNTRRYGNIGEVTPDAYIDDGVLDICVIIAGDPLTTVEQILSFLLRRKPGNGRHECFQGAHFWISVPESVDLQLDGSRVKIKKCSTAPDRTALTERGDAEVVMVTYRFDVVPGAQRVAVPMTYDDTLFEAASGEKRAPATEQQHPDSSAVRPKIRGSEKARHRRAKQIGALVQHGRKVAVVGIGPNPARKGRCIVAGAAGEEKAGESKPVAVRIDRNTALVNPAGEPLPRDLAASLAEGGVIVVEGKRSKRGVIRATRVVLI